MKKEFNKQKTAHTKVEKFFSTNYKNEINELSDEYPDKRSLLINYSDLKLFDHDLTDLLIKNPEDVLFVFEKAIKNLLSLEEDVNLNVRLDNFSPKISIKNLNANNVGTFISSEGIITEVNKPEYRIKTAAFECRQCMRLHTVEQRNINKIVEPSICYECGRKSFNLLKKDCKFIDSQKIIVKGFNTSKKVKLILLDDLTDFDKFEVNDIIEFTGIIKILSKKENDFNEFIHVNFIKNCPDEDYKEFIHAEIDEASRNSPEYRKWANNVLARDDSTCVVCGEKRAAHVHHIFSYKKHPDYRLNEENGVILCRWCHHKYHDIFGKDTANPVTLIKFMKGEYQRCLKRKLWE